MGHIPSRMAREAEQHPDSLAAEDENWDSNSDAHFESDSQLDEDEDADSDYASSGSTDQQYSSGFSPSDATSGQASDSPPMCSPTGTNLMNRKRPSTMDQRIQTRKVTCEPIQKSVPASVPTVAPAPAKGVQMRRNLRRRHRFCQCDTSPTTRHLAWCNLG
jgi:hypothetical protein